MLFTAKFPLFPDLAAAPGPPLRPPHLLARRRRLPQAVRQGSVVLIETFIWRYKCRVGKCFAYSYISNFRTFYIVERIDIKILKIQICQKRRRIGCVIPHCNLLRNLSFDFFDISVCVTSASAIKYYGSIKETPVTNSCSSRAQHRTDFRVYSDTIANGQKCHYKWGVIVTSHFYCTVEPIQVKSVSL